MKATCGILEDIGSERFRQIVEEHWSIEHDDSHSGGELARAAAAYLDHVADDEPVNANYVPGRWPWDLAFWKPKDRRRDLIRAAALIVAEIERMDRAGLSAPPPANEIATPADKLIEALFACAANCQGGHSEAGRMASAALGVPFPMRMADLAARAVEVGLAPRKLWPWLKDMNPALYDYAVAPATRIGGE